MNRLPVDQARNFQALEQQVAQLKAQVERLESENVALREANHRFSMAIQNCHVVYAQTDTNLAIKWIHSPYKSILDEKALGKRYDEIDDTSEARRFVSLQRQALESGERIQDRFTFQRPEGPWVYDTLIERLHDRSGVPVGTTISFLDITGMVQAEEEMRSMARFPGENPSPVLRISAGGQILYANPASAALLEQWQTSTGAAAPDDVHRIVADCLAQNIVREEEFTVGERTYSFTISPVVQNSDANLYGRDITERIRIENDLRLSQERFNRAFEASPNAQVISQLEDGRILEINHSFEALFGYRREEVIGKTSLELGLFANPDDRRTAVDQMHKSSSLRNYELDIRTRVGKTRQVSMSAELIHLNRDRLLLTILQDITETRLAALALKASEERLVDFLESTHDGFFALDRDWKIIYANQRVKEIAGADPAEIVGKILWEHWPRLLGSPLEKLYRSAMEERKPGNLQAQGLYSNTWYNISINPTRDGIAIFFADQTEQHRAENALQRSEQVLAQAGGLAHLGAWEIEVLDPSNLNANPQYWSAETARIFGYEPKPVEVSKELFLSHVHPEDRQRVESSLAQAVTTGTSYYTEHRVIRTDGIERVVQEHAEMVYDEKGTLTRIVGAVQDITERKQIEEALLSSQQDLARAQEVSHTGSWRLDLHNNLLLWSDETYRIFGIPIGTPMTYESFLATIHPDDREFVDTSWKAALQSGHYDIEHRIVVGKVVKWVREQAELEFDESGSLRSGFGTVHDISERIQVEKTLADYAAKLESSNQELERFAFVASHDLQEPLRKIKSFGDRVLSRLENDVDPETLDFLSRMVNASSRMQAMIDALLEMSRVTTRGSPFMLVDLTTIVEDVLSDLDNRVQDSGGEVILEKLPEVQADPIQMRQLFQNLLSNALKYHEPGASPRVKISSCPAQEAPGMVQITIEDNGIGFDQKYTEKLFQPFIRLVGRNQYEGSGMGLSICKKIVERHGGTISARSVPGEGSTFMITLPMPD